MAFMYRTASRVKQLSWLRCVSSRALWALRELEEHLVVSAVAKAVCGFLLLCVFTPILLLLGAATVISRWLLRRFIEYRYPDVEVCSRLTSALDSALTASDVTLLLELEGELDCHDIRNKLEADLLMRSDAGWKLPRLRQRICNILGVYVWEPSKDVDISQHILISRLAKRGHYASDQCVQDHVSVLCRRDLPVDRPPWQVFIIPLASSFLLLYRFHHLLDEDFVRNHLHTLFHFSPTSPASSTKPAASATHQVLRKLIRWGKEKIAISNKMVQELTAKYTTIVKTLPKRVALLIEELSETWKNPTDSLSSKIFTISKVFQLAELLCDFLIGKDGKLNTLLRLSSGMKTEFVILKQGVKDGSFKCMLRSFVNMCHPFAILKFVVCLGYTVICCILSVSCKAIMAVLNILEIVKKEYEVFRCHPDDSLLLFLECLREIWTFLQTIADIPCLILSFIPGKKHKTCLLAHSKSRSSIVSWSKSVPEELVQKIQTKTGVTYHQILLSLTSCALNECLQYSDYNVQDKRMTFISVTYCTFGQPTRALIHHLPLKLSSIRDVSCALRSTKRHFGDHRMSLASQIGTWMTDLMPAVLLRVMVWLLRKDSLGHVTSACVPFPLLVCGREVMTVRYWRPTKVTGGPSLSLVTFGGECHLSVMSDTSHQERHASITNFISRKLNELAFSTGVTRRFSGAK